MSDDERVDDDLPERLTKHAAYLLDTGKISAASAELITRAAIEVERLRAALAAEWQPIETAPRDGTTILVWFDQLFSGMADVAEWENDKYAKNPKPYWRGGGRWAYGINAYRNGRPTHWKPLLPPNNQTEG